MGTYDKHALHFWCYFFLLDFEATHRCFKCMEVEPGRTFGLKQASHMNKSAVRPRGLQIHNPSYQEPARLDIIKSIKSIVAILTFISQINTQTLTRFQES